MLIINNTVILNQHNSFICEKSHFKTSAEFFLTLKDKQYIFKINIVNNINFMTSDSIMQFIKMFVNVFSDNDSIMMISDSIIYKLLESK